MAHIQDRRRERGKQTILPRHGALPKFTACRENGRID
jgi:hypothetical protein